MTVVGGTYHVDENRSAQNRLGFGKGNHQRASRDLEGCRLRRPRRALLQLRSVHLFRVVFRKLSILLEQHQSWQLPRVSFAIYETPADYSLEFAFRSVLAEHSDRPIYLVFPTFRISSRAGMESSSGVSSPGRKQRALTKKQETY